MIKRYVILGALFWLAFIGASKTDTAIFLSAFFIVLAMPVAREGRG